jgi:hypothetical protein
VTDFLAVTRASTATRDDLDALMALFGKPDTAREAALAALETERRNAIQRTFALPKLAEQIDSRAAVNAEYAAKVEALRSFPPELLPENRDRWVA